MSLWQVKSRKYQISLISTSYKCVFFKNEPVSCSLKEFLTILPLLLAGSLAEITNPASDRDVPAKNQADKSSKKTSGQVSSICHLLGVADNSLSRDFKQDKLPAFCIKEQRDQVFILDSFSG